MMRDLNNAGEKEMLQYGRSGCIKHVRTPLLAMGSERRGLDDDGWIGEQRTGDFHVVAFSLVPIEVEFAGQNRTLLAPTTVAFTRPEITYFRSPQNSRGQRTIFIGLDTQTAFDVCEAMGQSAIDKQDPFPSRVGPCSSVSLGMAMQLDRLVFENDELLGALEFEENAMRIVEHALDTTYRALSTGLNRKASNHARRALVDRTLTLICCDPAKKWSLAELALSVDLSPAYLSRIFRSHTGRTLSQCLMLIRVVRAMEQLPDRRGSLTALALDCGFSSHSHMSSAFARILGVTPSELVKNSHKSIRNSIAQINSHLEQLRA